MDLQQKAEEMFSRLASINPILADLIKEAAKTGEAAIVDHLKSRLSPFMSVTLGEKSKYGAMVTMIIQAEQLMKLIESDYSILSPAQTIVVVKKSVNTGNDAPDLSDLDEHTRSAGPGPVRAPMAFVKPA